MNDTQRLQRGTTILTAGLLAWLTTAAIDALADEDLGRQLASKGNSTGAAACVGCHGSDGQGMAAGGFPRLAGLNADYLVSQLHAFRNGTRDNPIMTPIAAKLADGEIEAVAGYYALLPAATSGSSTPASHLEGDLLKRAELLATWGDWPQRRLPGCNQCHAPLGQGVGANFPGIAGQHASYLKAQLKAWQSGARRNDLLGMMRHVATSLSDEEIDLLAAYYASMPTGKAITAGNLAQVSVTKPAAGEASAPAAHQQAAFTPPSREQLPGGPFGDMVRLGEAIFTETNTHPISAPHVGNDQACTHCHLDAGRLADSSPLWAAWVSYPAYRKKNHKVNTYIERLQGCFTYSMNAQASKAGKPPAADSDTIVALTAYSYWLASGAPTGDNNMPGRGYPEVAATEKGFDVRRGAKVFADNCALCHGEDGLGVRDADGTTVFPPLWGERAYNWGAGMHRINTAAAFIKHNMPLGVGGLSDQDAWDVAAFMNSHERPQDPRYNGDFEDTIEQHHDSEYDYYGVDVEQSGRRLGQP